MDIADPSLFAGPPPAKLPIYPFRDATTPAPDDLDMDTRDETAAREPTDTLDDPSVVDDSKSGAMIAIDDTRPVEATIPLTEPDSAPVVPHRLYAIPGVPVVPLELVENILNHLHGCRGDLCKCALTHSSWYPCAIKVLYTDIHILGRREFDALRDRLRCRDVVAQCAFSHTEALRVTCDAIYAHDVLATLAGVTFPELRTLSFCIYDLVGGRSLPQSQRPPWIPPLPFSNTFSFVTTLSFIDQLFSTLRELVRTVCAFPQLQDLELRGFCGLKTRIDNARICVTPTTGGRLKLRRLLIGCVYGMGYLPYFLWWFFKTRAVQEPTLRILVCAYPDWRRSGSGGWAIPRPPPRSDIMAQLLNQLGSSLTTLLIRSTANGESSIIRDVISDI